MRINKKLAALSLLIPSFIIALFIYSYSTNVDYSQSTYNLALKAKQPFATPSKIILASEFNEPSKTVFKVNPSPSARYDSRLKVLNEKLLLPQDQLYTHIDTIEAEHKDILKQMRAQGILIDKVTAFNPRIKVVLSIVLDLLPTQIENQDIEDANLSSIDFYYLNLIADSSDFKILLKNQELNSSFLQISNIKRLYTNNRSTAQFN